MAICLPTMGLGSVSAYGYFKPENDPEVRLVVLDERQVHLGSIAVALMPADAIQLGKELIAEGERLTRPEDRVVLG